LRDTLESLVSQNFSQKQFEIIVADNGSTDETLDVAKDYKKKFPSLVNYVVENQIQSSYAARNKGVKVSKGSLISFVDADMTVKVDWLSKIVNSFNKDKDLSYLGCKVNIYSKKHSFASLYDILIGFPVEMNMNFEHYAPTCCLTVRRSIFDRIGFFDSRFKGGGDEEFGKRAWKNGIKMKYDSKIIMNHPARENIFKLFKKSLRVGRSRAETSSIFPDLFSHNIKRYLSIRPYLPRKIWKIKKRYKCGYSFNNMTVIRLSIFPSILQFVSVFPFILSKIKLLFK
tara:strand:- start:2894 stop:3748 length:855 start_codon:yes stop_codon:yes gene_type:complete